MFVCLTSRYHLFREFHIRNPDTGGSDGGHDDMGVLQKIQRLGLQVYDGLHISNQFRDNQFLVQWVQ